MKARITRHETDYMKRRRDEILAQMIPIIHCLSAMHMLMMTPLTDPNPQSTILTASSPSPRSPPAHSPPSSSPNSNPASHSSASVLPPRAPQPARPLRPAAP